MTTEHKAVRVEGDECRSLWHYRGVFLRYYVAEREWTFTLYMEKGWARVMSPNRAAAMRRVDQLIDEENFVADVSLYDPARVAS